MCSPPQKMCNVCDLNGVTKKMAWHDPGIFPTTGPLNLLRLTPLLVTPCLPKCRPGSTVSQLTFMGIMLKWVSGLLFKSRMRKDTQSCLVKNFICTQSFCIYYRLYVSFFKKIFLITTNLPQVSSQMCELCGWSLTSQLRSAFVRAIMHIKNKMATFLPDLSIWFHSNCVCSGCTDPDISPTLVP